MTREDVRNHCAQAEAGTVAFDDCNGRKVLRIRVDTPQEPYKFDGVIGVFRKSYDPKQQGVVPGLSEDHAALTLQSMKSKVNSFFTPAEGLRKLSRKRRWRDSPSAAGDGPVCVTQAVDAFRKKMRFLASDGGTGERRVVFLAAEKFFPGVVLAIRDMAHALRIATQKPLQLESMYGEVYNALIDRRHALIPDITNSPKWRQMLEAIQLNVLRVNGMSLSGSLQVVLRHLSFAKQRMDSCADPLAKTCLMLMPIALLLSFLSCDERVAPQQRQRAADMLKLMKTKFLLAAGVSSDWGLICLKFLRLYDRLDHDIANSYEELAFFKGIAHACFISGHVFMKPVSRSLVAAGASSAATGANIDTEGIFITERVRRQTQEPVLFRCGTKAGMQWGPINRTDLQDLVQRTRVAGRLMIDRVVAEHEGLRKDFRCLSCKQIAKAFLQPGGMSSDHGKTLMSCLRHLARAFQMDERILQIEYKEWAPKVNDLWKQAVTADARLANDDFSFDNSKIWTKFLDKKAVSKIFPSRAAPFSQMPLLVRMHRALLDGECQLERDLAQVRRFCAEHKIGGDSLLDDLIILKCSGPQENDALATRAASGALEPTNFLLRCARLWRLYFGTKFQVDYSSRRRVESTGGRRKPFTFQQVRRAVHAAALSAHSADKAAQPSSDTMTTFGEPCSFFASPLGERSSELPSWNAALAKFQRRTLANKN